MCIRYSKALCLLTVFTQLTILLTFALSYHDHLPRLNGNLLTRCYCKAKRGNAYKSSTNVPYARCLREMGEREAEKEREREREREKKREQEKKKIRLFCPGCALAFVCILVFFPFIILVLPSFTVQSSCLFVFSSF